jgi:glycosyltransferase involved in cell wall biosynthesis
VDDCSQDKSLEIAFQLKAKDSRVKIISLNVNVGTYVAKNLALASAKGKYITVHDADDWAFPTRIAEQMQPLLNASTAGLSVTMGRTLRFKKNGQFTRFIKTNINCLDGANRLCYPSPLFERNFFDQIIGAWDSVRMGADSEIFNRVLRFEPSKIQISDKFLMLQLDIEDSITRQDETHNDDRGESPLRLAYRKSWAAWHESLSTMPRLEFPQSNRPFEAPVNIQSATCT